VGVQSTEKRLSAGTLLNFTPFRASFEVTNTDDFCIATSTGEI
jgi:hypothetical protein